MRSYENTSLFTTEEYLIPSLNLILIRNFRDTHVSADFPCDLIRRVENRNSMVRFMKSMMRDNKYFAIYIFI
jgi:hypothetical protein